VAAWVPDMFGDFYFMKNAKFANDLTTTKAREKINTYLRSLEFENVFDVGLAKFQN
jgi:hypothetical protein